MYKENKLQKIIKIIWIIVYILFTVFQIYSIINGYNDSINNIENKNDDSQVIINTMPIVLVFIVIIIGCIGYGALIITGLVGFSITMVIAKKNYSIKEAKSSLISFFIITIIPIITEAILIITTISLGEKIKALM